MGCGYYKKDLEEDMEICKDSSFVKDGDNEPITNRGKSLNKENIKDKKIEKQMTKEEFLDLIERTDFSHVNYKEK